MCSMAARCVYLKKVSAKLHETVEVTPYVKRMKWIIKFSTFPTN